MTSFREFLFITCFIGVFISCSPIQYVAIDESVYTSTNLAPTVPVESESFENQDIGLFKDNNEHIDRWIKYFAEGHGRQSMKNYLERSNRYISLMKGIFKEHDLPEDLVYIAMVESGFQSSVVSSKNAVGYWQFIESTGKRYGLTINNIIDERQDFVLVTQAAARYLKDLYEMFEDWNLAIAAYNAGEGRVSKALHNSFHKDYWSLVENKKLPKETSQFVPKIIAMKKIAVHPWKYNFSNLNYYEPLDYSSVNISKSFSLKNLAEVIKVPHEELLGLNPKYKQDIVPLLNGKKIEIRIPASIAFI